MYFSSKLIDRQEVEGVLYRSFNTLKELKEAYKGVYSELQVFSPKQFTYLWNIDDMIPNNISDDVEILEYRLLSEQDYTNMVLVNTPCKADFESWYGNKKAKVLVVKIKEDVNYD